jgi:UDP-N-acetylmuramyl pentapeptide synthase
MNEDKVFKFGDNKTAGRFLQDLIKRGDIILIKGSQGARMEQIIKELMADPLKASSLLVRQSKEWLG